MFCSILFSAVKCNPETESTMGEMGLKNALFSALNSIARDFPDLLAVHFLIVVSKSTAINESSELQTNRFPQEPCTEDFEMQMNKSTRLKPPRHRRPC